MPKMRKGLGLREENFARMEEAVGPGVHKNSARPFGGELELFSLMKMVVNILSDMAAEEASIRPEYLRNKSANGREREIS